MRSELENLHAKILQARADRERLERCLDGEISVARPVDGVTQGDLEEAALELAEGRHLEAELIVSHLLGECTGGAASWSLLGKLWHLQGAPRAPAALRRAIAIDPKLAEAYLGLAHALAGDPAAIPEAAMALERFLELVPYGPEADSARRALASLPPVRR
jgi:tetratricopeptide (TPR) repeat protein